MPHTKNKHECTMNGLNEWFKAKFEKLGWMVLAKEHGCDIKVSAYLQSISHLKDCLKDKIESVHDLDRKDDFTIMLRKTEILITAANNILNSRLGSSSKHKKHQKKSGDYDATFYGLHKWETAMFEKLGWMVLAKNEGNNLKIKSYMYSIHCLKNKLMKKIDEVHDKDRKDDLKILHEQICILWKAAAKLLGSQGSFSSHGHSDEAKSSMKMIMDKDGIKHLSHQSSHSQKKHKKQRHTRKDLNPENKKTKKSKKSKKTKRTKSSGSVFGGLF